MEKYKNLTQKEINKKFFAACKGGRLDVVKFLIFDVNIEKTKGITKFLMSNEPHEISGWFAIRDLSDKISRELFHLKTTRKGKV